MGGLTCASLLGFIGSFSAYKILSAKLKAAENGLKSAENKTYVDSFDNLEFEESWANTKSVDTKRNLVNGLTASSKTAAWMSAGFAVAMVILASLSVYFTWQDMKAYYNVEFSPIPHYMVDAASITYYNANKEKLVKENHAAYCKAVTCNRPDTDKNFKALSDCADLNGDVGQQWVALYACRDNKVMPPILADSFTVVVGSSSIPAGYTKGIHMFGSDSAFNMNNKLYVWEQKARPVFVYYKLDMTAPLSEPTTAGAAFSGGVLALAGVGGLGLGALITALSMTAWRKRKRQPV